MTDVDKPRKGPRYSYGVEWRNPRGQVFVQLPDHPMARADGFYARAKFVMEEQIASEKVGIYDARVDKGDIKGPVAVVMGPDIDGLWGDRVVDVIIRTPRVLTNEERVYHLDGQAGNDDPANLALFSCQKAIAQFRSQQYHKSKDANYRDRMKGLTEAQKEAREVMGTARAQAAEKRSRAAKAAHQRRKREARGKPTEDAGQEDA